MKKVAYTCAVFFILFVGIIGCSDVPYTGHTGSMLQPSDVDKYISSPAPDKVCLQNDGESVCVDLRQGKKRKVIHIYPKSIVYTFYYDDVILLQAEHVDASPNANNEANSNNTDTDGATGDTGDGQDTPAESEVDTSDPDIVEPVVPDGASIRRKTAGWLVRIYYRDGIPAGATPSLEGSGFLINVFESDGTDIADKVERVELIRTDEGDALRFFAPSTQDRLTVRVQGLIGTKSVTTFTVDTQGDVKSEDESDPFQTDEL